MQLRRRWRWLRAKGTVVLTVKLTVKINDAQQIKMTKNLRNVEHKLLKTSATHSFNKTCRQNQLTLNHLTPNDHYSGRNAPLTSKLFILYIYSTNIGTEYFKNGINSPFFPLQNAVCFIILTYLVPVLFKFYIKKLKKIILAPNV